MRHLALVLPLLLLSGCLSEILGPVPQTTRSFACTLLSDDPDTLEIRLTMEEGIGRQPTDAIEQLRQVLGNVTPRDLEAIILNIGDRVERPEDDWSLETMREQAEDFIVDRQTMRLHILWLADLPGGTVTGMEVQAGAIAVSDAAVAKGVESLGKPRTDVARAILLHHIGHALGVVNNGIPMKSNHESPAKHEPSLESVMHDSWHDPDRLQWAPDGTYDHFSNATHNDWEYAVTEGVCLQ